MQRIFYQQVSPRHQYVTVVFQYFAELSVHPVFCRIGNRYVHAVFRKGLSQLSICSCNGLRRIFKSLLSYVRRSDYIFDTPLLHGLDKRYGNCRILCPVVYPGQDMAVDIGGKTELLRLGISIFSKQPEKHRKKNYGVKQKPERQQEKTASRLARPLSGRHNKNIYFYRKNINKKEKWNYAVKTFVLLKNYDYICTPLRKNSACYQHAKQ